MRARKDSTPSALFPAAYDVLGLIVDSGAAGITGVELGAHLHRSPSNCHYLAAGLARHGLITKSRHHRTVRYYYAATGNHRESAPAGPGLASDYPSEPSHPTQRRC